MSCISARLIQSNDGFDLYHLAELRYFLKKLEGDGPVLDEALWQRAKEALKRCYQRSTCLPLCLRILETWESVNSTKYRSDLELFLHESKLEDFYEETVGTVCVSTLHKSKGREFDRVWLLLNRYDFSTDEKKRAVYVGMTRAKSELHIHTDSTFFDVLMPQGVQRKVEERVYPEPEELLLELTHRDVVLDYFKDKKRLILSLKSGDRLELAGSYLYAGGQTIARLSQRGRERLSKLVQSGYYVFAVHVRFVVAWKGEQDLEETAVVLPTLCLRKEKTQMIYE